MGETFLALLAAHLLADFPGQPTWMVRRKRNPAVLVLHAVVVTGLAALAVGGGPPRMLLILAATHLSMDALKVYVLGDALWSFLLDQAVHLLVIAALAAGFPQALAAGAWTRLPPPGLMVYLAGLCLVSGIVASLQTGAILIRKATAGFTAQIEAEMNAAPARIEGLDKGGLYIGCLERALVMLLILIGQPAGVGFLITAKSILRFGDVKDSGQRKLTEYIIIGTFMSFGWGLLIAVLTQAGIGHFMALTVAPGTHTAKG